MIRLFRSQQQQQSETGVLNDDLPIRHCDRLIFFTLLPIPPDQPNPNHYNA
ncbi:hypothetical protein [Pantanalinema sp. GBBB05]|uniref:hypothetical protein n=1 Tax=Pantanalinema sp. GBBB05 TaxID=2604139 RepID=UPI003D812DE0